MAKQPGEVYIGTSGWSYPHWKGRFYPADLRHEAELGFYAQHLRSVEINYSFYRLPSLETLAHWREITPTGFVFAAKASRYITHRKRLRDAAKVVPTFMARVEALGKKLGPVLFQLPPHWAFNVERLREFLAALRPGPRYAFEFRDSSWFDERAYALLEQYGCAFCIYDLNGQRSPAPTLADWVYIRLHGPTRAYAGAYDEEMLRSWATDIVRWSREGRAVYCYFNNDENAYAVENARRLQALVGDARS